MRWWCSANGAAWSWEWRPFIGAWVVIVGAVGWLAWAGTWRRDVPPRRKIAAVIGLVLLLGAIDWPLSALGAGYIVSAQMIRQVLIVTIAAPLLLFGAPESLGRWLEATPRRRAVVRALTYPLVSLGISVVLLISVSVPVIVDPLITSQLGSFVLDLAWISAGFLIWMPVQPPSPMAPRLSGPVAVVYLIAVSIAPLPIAFFMTWSEFPIYSVYELAPRVFDSLDAKSDQELAAAIFQVAGGLVIWIQIAVRFIAMSGGLSGPKFRGTLVPDSSPAEVS